MLSSTINTGVAVLICECKLQATMADLAVAVASAVAFLLLVVQLSKP